MPIFANRGRALTATAVFAALCAGALLAPAVCMAMPPSPQLLQRAENDPALEERIEDYLDADKPAGLDEPTTQLDVAALSTPWLSSDVGVRTLSSSVFSRSGVPGAYRQLVLLVDFSDKPATVASSFFDDLLFKDVVGPASVRGYYREVSAGALDIQPVSADLPSARGWLRMPQPYSYYCPSGSMGEGPYPNNVQKLAEDALAAAEAAGTDFSAYDNDHDGVIDGVVVVHSGRGQEMSGNPADIWSHQWGVRNSKVYDGVRTSVYTTEPEYWNSPRDMTTGVFCHELGHAFGLSDLYDTDYSSRGVGVWSLMAGGSWNGGNGRTPARPDAFSMVELGFEVPTQITTSTVVTIHSATSSVPGDVFRVEKAGVTGGKQYFLIENRQRTGTDAALPGSGLLIWHIDENMRDNDDEVRYMVDLEEAHGGTQHLSANTGNGDAGDPFPGTAAKMSFGETSVPSSAYYDGSGKVDVSGISASSAAMTAQIAPQAVAADTTPPRTTSDVRAIYDTSATVTLAVSDAGSGVASTRWVLDGVAGTGLTVRATTLGTHTLSYWSTDVAGNVETAVAATFVVRDVTLPIVTSDAAATYSDSAAVRVSGRDETGGSGFATITGRLDSDAARTSVGSSAVFETSAPGAHTLQFSGTDAAGNRSATSTVTFTVRALVPEAPEPEASAAEVSGDSVTVEWNAVENAASYECELNGIAAETVTGLSVSVSGLDVGDNALRVRALNAYGDASAWSRTLTVLRRTTIDAVAEIATTSTVSVSGGGSGAVLTVLVTDDEGAGIPGRLVTCQYSYDQVIWADLATLTTDATGTAAYAYRPAKGMWVRWVVLADSEYLATTSAAVKVTVLPNLGKPVTPSTVRHGRTFTISGYLKPRHARGAHSVSIKLYRYRNGKWSLYKTVRATNSDYGTYTKFSVRTNVPTKGSWRARAYYAGTTSFASATSAYRQFKSN